MAMPIYFVENPYETGVVHVVVIDYPFNDVLDVVQMDNPWLPGVLLAYQTENPYEHGVIKVRLVSKIETRVTTFKNP